MIILKGGLIINGSGREPLPNTDIVIDDNGRITRVGKVRTFPSGMEVIDITGKTVMPGLIDCHVHLYIDLKPMHELAIVPMTLRTFEAVQRAKDTLDGGVTTVRDAAGVPRGFKQAAERGMFPCPRLVITVVMLSQTSGHGDNLLPSGAHQILLPSGNPLEWPDPICDGVDGVRKKTREVLRAGADVIKLATSGGMLSPGSGPTTTQFTREEISAIVYEAAAQGKKCMAHAQSLQGIRNAVECGVESIEHGVYLDESLIDEMKRRNTFLVPTLQAVKAVLRRAEENPGSVLPQSLKKSKDSYEVQRKSARMAIEAGVRIAMGTDAGVGEHGTNAEELQLLVETGMTPMQAIVAATKTASECVHLSQDIGTLEMGKLADLLVIDGNPLDNISILRDKSKLLLIMQGGRVHKNVIPR